LIKPKDAAAIVTSAPAVSESSAPAADKDKT
jgi:hypothetical protein